MERGIIVPADYGGRFDPDRPATRAEAAALALRLLDVRRGAARMPADDGVIPVWEASAFRVRTVRTNNPIHYEVAAHGDVIYTRAGDRILALKPDGGVRAEWPLPQGDAFYAVKGMAAAPDGTLYVGLGTRVARLSDGTPSVVAGTGRQTPADGPPDEAQFTSITSLVYGPDGRLYISDSNNIRVVGSDGYTATFAGPRPEQPAPDLGGASAGNGMGAGWPQYRPGGPPAQTIINAAGGISFGPDGSLYAGGYQELARVTPEGWVHWLRTPAGVIADGGPAESLFWEISALAADPLGNLWVADKGNHRIRLVTPGGRVITVAGSGWEEAPPPAPPHHPLPPHRPATPSQWRLKGDHRDGPAKEAAFEDITGVALDGRGRLWVADNGYLRVIEGLASDTAHAHGQTLLPVPPVRQGDPLAGVVLVQAAMDWPYVTLALEVDGTEVGRTDEGLFSIPWDTRSVGDGTHSWRLRGRDRAGRWHEGPASTSIVVQNRANTYDGTTRVEIVRPGEWGSWVRRGQVPVVVFSDGTARSLTLTIDGRVVKRVERASGKRVLTYLWDTSSLAPGAHRLKVEYVNSSGHLVRDIVTHEVTLAEEDLPLPRPVRVLLNGRRLVYEDIVPVAWKDTVLIPFRQTFVHLGWWPDFAPATRTLKAATDASGRERITLSIDTGMAETNGRQFQVRPDAVPLLYKNLVPLSFFEEALGAKTTWNPDTSTVTIDVATEHFGNRPIEPFPAP